MDTELLTKDVHTSTGARVYLLWAVICGVGFTATHYYQDKNIVAVWAVLSVIGLGYMYKVMPLKQRQMKNIYLSWLVPIIVGMVVSALAVRSSILPELVRYLGAYWLVVMAVGYGLNGLSDKPAKWYFIAAALNLVAAFAIYYFKSIVPVQYLITAVISVWSMLYLWIFRSEADS